MIKKGLALGMTSMLLLGVTAPMALAITRDEYKTQVEPICKKNSEANDKILKTVRKEVKENKLKTAGAKFLKASAALTTTYNELKAVEQPTEDAAKLTKWLGYVKTEAELFASGGKALITSLGQPGLTKERRQRRYAAIPQAVREDWDLLVPFFLHIGQGMLPCFLDARVDLATWFALARSAVGRQASSTQVAI